MDKTTKQTALFFGFLASAMTYASAQAPAVANPAQPTPAVERQASDLRPAPAPNARQNAGKRSDRLRS